MNFRSLLEEVTRLVRVETAGSGIGIRELLDHIPGLAKDSPKALLSLGFLATVEQFSPDARRMVPVITRESADLFLAEYVTLGELCRRTDLHHKRVRLLLRGASIKEIFPFEQVGCFVYSRREIESVEARDPGFWRYQKLLAQEAARAR